MWRECPPRLSETTTDRVTLRAGGDTASFDLAWGGRLASLIAGGAERLLAEPPAGVEPRDLLWGSYLMAPWAGRIRDGALHWQGRLVKLPVNFGPHPIHGLVHSRRVEVVDRTESRLTTSCALDWELGGSVRQGARLTQGSLELTAEVNSDAESMPVWAGWHPLFRRPAVEDVRVIVRARGMLEVAEDMIPTGRVMPIAGASDLSAGLPLGKRRIDRVYVGASGPAVIDWPDLRLTLDWDPPMDTVTVYTPEFCFCVEPQSGWPDALRLGNPDLTGWVELQPRERLRLRTRWRWRPITA